MNRTDVDYLRGLAGRLQKAHGTKDVTFDDVDRLMVIADDLLAHQGVLERSLEFINNIRLAEAQTLAEASNLSVDLATALEDSR